MGKKKKLPCIKKDPVGHHIMALVDLGYDVYFHVTVKTKKRIIDVKESK